MNEIPDKSQKRNTICTLDDFLIPKKEETNTEPKQSYIIEDYDLAKWWDYTSKQNKKKLLIIYMKYELDKDITKSFLDHITSISFKEFLDEEILCRVIHRITREIDLYLISIFSSSEGLLITIKNGKVFIENSDLEEFWNNSTYPTLKTLFEGIDAYKKFPKDLKGLKWKNISPRRKQIIKTRLVKFRQFLLIANKRRLTH